MPVISLLDVYNPHKVAIRHWAWGPDGVEIPNCRWEVCIYPARWITSLNSFRTTLADLPEDWGTSTVDGMLSIMLNWLLHSVGSNVVIFEETYAATT